MFVEVSQKSGPPLRLHYELRGRVGAPPLLLIRGLARHSLHWGRLPEFLEDEFRLVLFDNRGMGRSDVPRPPYTTRRMADDAAEVLGAAGFERAHVFGMSLGGMIAQEFALRHPARVERLVLGCTRAGPGTGPRIAPKLVLEMLGAGRFAPEEAIARTAHMALGERFIAAHPEVIAEWRSLARDYPPARAGFLGQLIAGGLHDTRRRLGRVVQPTLVITGDADNLIHADHSRYLARKIRGARLEVLPGAGHDFTTERPEVAARLLKSFLLADQAQQSTAAE